MFHLRLGCLYYKLLTTRLQGSVLFHLVDSVSLAIHPIHTTLYGVIVVGFGRGKESFKRYTRQIVVSAYLKDSSLTPSMFHH